MQHLGKEFYSLIIAAESSPSSPLKTAYAQSRHKALPTPEALYRENIITLHGVAESSLRLLTWKILIGRPGTPVDMSPDNSGIVLLEDPDMRTGGHSFRALSTTSSFNTTNGHGKDHSFNGAINDGCKRTTQDLIDAPGESGSSRAPPPIAIVGIGMRLPGRINDECAFWEMLINKRSGRGVVPADRYNVHAFYSADGEPGTVKTKHGYFSIM